MPGAQFRFGAVPIVNVTAMLSAALREQFIGALANRVLAYAGMHIGFG
jgi:hypothetical protein